MLNKQQNESFSNIFPHKLGRTNSMTLDIQAMDFCVSVLRVGWFLLIFFVTLMLFANLSSVFWMISFCNTTWHIAVRDGYSRLRIIQYYHLHTLSATFTWTWKELMIARLDHQLKQSGLLFNKAPSLSWFFKRKTRLQKFSVGDANVSPDHWSRAQVARRIRYPIRFLCLLDKTSCFWHFGVYCTTEWSLKFLGFDVTITVIDLPCWWQW